MLECVPDAVATTVTEAVPVPTIGIGAGAHCDGQVLVMYDLLGMDPEFAPKFVKKYADLGTIVPAAIARFKDEIEAGVFPAEEHTFHTKEQLFGLEVVSSVEEEDDGLAGLYGVPV